MAEKTDLTMDDRWMLVKDFYESTTPFRFRTRLADKDIMFLYKKMYQLGADYANLSDKVKEKAKLKLVDRVPKVDG